MGPPFTILEDDSHLNFPHIRNGAYAVSLQFKVADATRHGQPSVDHSSTNIVKHNFPLRFLDAILLIYLNILKSLN